MEETKQNKNQPPKIAFLFGHLCTCIVEIQIFLCFFTCCNYCLCWASHNTWTIQIWNACRKRTTTFMPPTNVLNYLEWQAQWYHKTRLLWNLNSSNPVTCTFKSSITMFTLSNWLWLCYQDKFQLLAVWPKPDLLLHFCV